MPKCVLALIRTSGNLSAESGGCLSLLSAPIEIRAPPASPGSPGFAAAAEMADSPLRHGSLLPDWLVNRHNQIQAPSGATVRRYDRTGQEHAASPYPHHPFVGEPLPPCQCGRWEVRPFWVLLSERQDNRQADYFKNRFFPGLSQCGAVVAVERILEEIIIIFRVGAFAAEEPPSNTEIHIILTGPP